MDQISTFNLESLAQFLTEHIANNCLVSPEESQKNLEQNVVGIYNLKSSTSSNTTPNSYKVDSAGCGLRLTTDGYILTAFHVIEAAYEKLHGAVDGPNYVWINDLNNSQHYLDPSFMVVDPEYDLALIKAYDPHVGEMIRFNLNYEGLGFKQKISALALDHKNKEIVSTEGTVYAYLKNFPTVNSKGTRRSAIAELFLTSAPIQFGNSGGIFITEDGSLAGTINTKTSLSERGGSSSIEGGCGVDICHGMGLIATLASSLGEKYF